MATFIVAQHTAEGKLVLCVCDKEVHGKKYEDKAGVLDLASRFYSGEEMGQKEAESLMLQAYVINAAGMEAVAMAIKAGLASESDAKEISGVRHVQVLML